MSENKGKAKVKSKSKSVAKSAGKNKAAVMDTRSPKKPVAISGDTMNSGSMYKKGGKVKKYATGGMKKYQTKGQTGESIGDKIDRNVEGFLVGSGIKNIMQAGPGGPGSAGYAAGSALAGDLKPAKDYVKRKLGMKKKGGTTKKYAAGGSFPDLNGDGKITKADILKGRGVIKKKGGMTKSKSKK
jgi:hypothetical protein